MFSVRLYMLIIFNKCLVQILFQAFDSYLMKIIKIESLNIFKKSPVKVIYLPKKLLYSFFLLDECYKLHKLNQLFNMKSKRKVDI